jgi:hypothetical protein
VTDADGTVKRLDFYRDANGNGVFDSGVDVLLGSDTKASDGWSWTGRIDGLTVGSRHKFLAVAQDDGGLRSGAASTSLLVSSNAESAITDITRQWVGDGSGTPDLSKLLLYGDTNGNKQFDGGTDSLLASIDQRTQVWTWIQPGSLGSAKRLFAVGQQEGGQLTDVLATIEII